MFEKLNRENKRKVNPILDNKILEKKNSSVQSDAAKKQNSRRNVKLYDDGYFDLLALAQCLNLTHNDLVVYLVNNEVQRLSEDQKKVYEYLRSTIENKKTNKK